MLPPTSPTSPSSSLRSRNALLSDGPDALGSSRIVTSIISCTTSTALTSTISSLLSVRFKTSNSDSSSHLPSPDVCTSFASSSGRMRHRDFHKFTSAVSFLTVRTSISLVLESALQAASASSLFLEFLHMSNDLHSSPLAQVVLRFSGSRHLPPRRQRFSIDTLPIRQQVQDSLRYPQLFSTPSPQFLHICLSVSSAPCPPFLLQPLAKCPIIPRIAARRSSSNLVHNSLFLSGDDWACDVQGVM